MVEAAPRPWYLKEFKAELLSEIQKKLGIREKQRMLVINPPSNYLNVLGQMPRDITMNSFDEQGIDLVHAFFYWKKELEHLIPLLKYKIKKSGGIWISWPMQASRNDSDMNEKIVRKIGQDNGLEESRNIAFTSQWGAIKFVWPES